MNHKFWVLFAFASLLTLTDYTEANNLVAYYTAAASTVLIAAAAVIFKALHLCYWIYALSSAGYRKKRSTDEDEDPFDKMADTDPAMCYQRLICDLAVRYDDKNVIVSSSDNSTNSKYAVIPFFLTSQKFSEESTEYDYSIAAKFGRSSKSFDACQTKYSCPIDLTELKTKFI